MKWIEKYVKKTCGFKILEKCKLLELAFLGKKIKTQKTIAGFQGDSFYIDITIGKQIRWHASKIKD
jgi:hypothetical protein